MGGSESRQITHNWVVVHDIGPTWVISEPFGFTNSNTGSFYINTAARNYGTGWDCLVKINKVGGININAKIEAKLNDKSLGPMIMTNWTAFSDEFVFDGTPYSPPYNISCTIKLDSINDKASETVQELANVKDFFLSPEFSDIAIKVGEEEFPAHKIVLACSSVIFKKMLSTEMKEKKENCIDLSDYNAKSIKEGLRFLYGGKVQANDIELLLNLSSFAHMYQINRLKDYCESKLVNSFQVDNIIEILVTIDNYGMDKVKNEAMEFLIKNKATVSFDDAINNIKSSQVLRKFFSNLTQMKN